MSDVLTNWQDHHTGKQTLPCCGYEIDTISLTDGKRGEDIPAILARGEAFSVCMQCGQWLIINPDLTQRLVTAEEIAAMPADFRAKLRTMTTAVQEVRAKRAKQ